MAASSAFVLPLVWKRAAATDPPLTTYSNYGDFHFGWLPDSPSYKINAYAAPFGFDATSPKAVDLRNEMPPVYDQGPIGSCVSNAVAAAIQHLRRKTKQTPDFAPSRLFIYYYGRSLENSIASDSGLSVGDGLSALETKGVCPESMWPYDSPPADKDGKFPSDSRAVLKPRKEILTEALRNQVMDAHSIDSRGDDRIADLKACLADGYPFILGFSIYKSFFNAKKKPLSDVPVPPLDDTKVGGHAVLVVGYDSDKQYFICRNSWGLKDKDGSQIQDKGHFRIPFEYVKNDDLVGGLWTIRALSH